MKHPRDGRIHRLSRWRGPLGAVCLMIPCACQADDPLPAEVSATPRHHLAAADPALDLATADEVSASTTIELLDLPLADNMFVDAVLERPARCQANGWGVLLIGGGYGNDRDWTVPGELAAVEGQPPTRVTISGSPHADGELLSRSLADAGFVVLRYATIARDDPLRDRWPIEATPRTLPELLDFARRALHTLRSVEGSIPTASSFSVTAWVRRGPVPWPTRARRFAG